MRRPVEEARGKTDCSLTPAAATGTLAKKTQKFAVSAVPSTVFWNSNAIDLPFFLYWRVFVPMQGASAVAVYTPVTARLRPKSSST